LRTTKQPAMKNYHIVSKIAIYLLSVVMISFGIYHFQNARDLVVYIPSSLPGGIWWVYLTGAAFILVAISFITNRMVKTSAYLLAFILFVFILTLHVPNYLNAGDKEMKAMAFVNLLKDTAIAGFALHIAAGAHHQKLHMEQSD
jgi:putative oxidoreductase